MTASPRPVGVLTGLFLPGDPVIVRLTPKRAKHYIDGTATILALPDAKHPYIVVEVGRLRTRAAVNLDQITYDLSRTSENRRVNHRSVVTLDGQDLTGPGFAFTGPGMTTVAVAEAEVARARELYEKQQVACAAASNRVSAAHAALRAAKQRAEDKAAALPPEPKWLGDVIVFCDRDGAQSYIATRNRDGMWRSMTVNGPGQGLNTWWELIDWMRRLRVQSYRVMTARDSETVELPHV